jgi:hypothetical protein
MPKTAERPGDCRAFPFSPDVPSALLATLLATLLAGLVLPALLLLAALTGLLAALLTAALLTTLVLLAALLLLIVLVWIVHGRLRLVEFDFTKANHRPNPSFPNPSFLVSFDTERHAQFCDVVMSVKFR